MRFGREAEGWLLEAVLWRRLDETALKRCRLWETAEAYVLEGTLLTLIERSPAEVRYRVDCGRDWRTRTVQVALTVGDTSRVMALRRDEEGRWWRDGAQLHVLDGLVEVDLGFTPATNTLPIRRLGLEVGASATVDAAWVRAPELELERLSQRYTRLDARRYRCESAGGAFESELEVDEHGVVVSSGGCGSE